MKHIILWIFKTKVNLSYKLDKILITEKATYTRIIIYQDKVRQIEKTLINKIFKLKKHLSNQI